MIGSAMIAYARSGTISHSCNKSKNISSILNRNVRLRMLSSLPDSVKRVGKASMYPDEYPGNVYIFNWALNRDGVTPINESAFRITKPLDLRVAGLEQPKKRPLKIDPSPSGIPEAGSDELSYEDYDVATQSIKDALSMSATLYCPEGHAPASSTTVRVITNSPTVATDLSAYLERAPKVDPPPAQAITVYALELDGSESNSEVQPFAGYAIEEVEEIDHDIGERMEPKSMAAVVMAGATIDLPVLASGIEKSVEGLAADAAEREEAKAAAAENSA